jgi:signal transduction histidine kinase
MHRMGGRTGCRWGPRATIRLAYDPRDLVLEITDTGRRNGTEADSPGKGLIGMRERTRLYGGSLEAAQTPTGFPVAARLPLEPADGR